jgi:hypothetical protein
MRRRDARGAGGAGLGCAKRLDGGVTASRLQFRVGRRVVCEGPHRLAASRGYRPAARCAEEQGNRARCVSGHRDEDLALGPAAFDVGEGLRGLVEWICPVEDGSEDIGFDELGYLVELGTAGAHEQERIPDAVAARRSACLQAQPGYAQPQWKPESALAGEVWVGGPAMPMTVPPGLRTRRDLASVSPPWVSRTRS